jgi:hypothetical protein
MLCPRRLVRKVHVLHLRTRHVLHLHTRLFEMLMHALECPQAVVLCPCF